MKKVAARAIAGTADRGGTAMQWTLALWVLAAVYVLMAVRIY